MRHIYFLLLLTTLVTSLHAADNIPLHGSAAVHFASLEEGQTQLQNRDRFVSALSPFDRASRLETDQPVAENAYLEFVAAQVRPWEPEQIAKLTTAVGQLRSKLTPFNLPFPKSVLVIQTTGREQGNAAYCRGNAVILPSEKVSESADELEQLFNHELFHILSSHNPGWRDKLYEIIGFHPCPPIELPESLRDRKLTNPDAPNIDSFISIDVEGEAISAVPVLYSRTDKFDRKVGGPFFRYLEFRLMAIEKNDGKWVPAKRNGEPQLLQPRNIPDYHRQIGKNTNYIIHPDEILADNFVHLVQGAKSLPSPQIVEQMRAIVTTK